MWRLFEAVVAHRSMLKAIFLGIAVVAMALGISGDALADDDGVGP